MIPVTITITGSDIGFVITAATAFLTVAGNFLLSIIQLKKSQENGRKLDENTQLTKATAVVAKDTADKVDAAVTGTIDVSALRKAHDENPHSQ
jgi:hypothetical protein